MKVFSVVGLTKSGKTTVIEQLIAGLTARGYTVGTVKEIHNQAFAIDVEGKNTYRHRAAGADTVTARGLAETDVLYKGKLPIYQILSHYNQDFVILEGVRDAVVPVISICGDNQTPIITPLTFAISGVYANNGPQELMGLPVINALTDCDKLLDLVISKTPPLFYDIDPQCCSLCGTSCRELLARHLKGEDCLKLCKLFSNVVELKINDKPVVIVPFVQNILKNVLMGVVSELKGYEKNAKIEVVIKDEN